MEGIEESTTMLRSLERAHRRMLRLESDGEDDEEEELQAVQEMEESHNAPIKAHSPTGGDGEGGDTDRTMSDANEDSEALAAARNGTHAEKTSNGVGSKENGRRNSSVKEEPSAPVSAGQTGGKTLPGLSAALGYSF